jgi:hypothetical protein
MAFTDVQICANALIRLGAHPIQSFDEGTDIATACDNIYKMKSDYMLSSYPWRFTMKFMQLSRTVAKPVAQWEHQFTLPADRIQSGPPAVYGSDGIMELPMKNYNIVGIHLVSNNPVIWVKYQSRVDESEWSPYFVELMTYVMMGELAVLVTDNASLKQTVDATTYGIPSEYGVGGLYGKAMALDSRDNPTTRLLDDTLLGARFGGVGY